MWLINITIVCTLLLCELIKDNFDIKDIPPI